MSTLVAPAGEHAAYPVRVNATHCVDNRNRLTTLFRLFLAIPHLILVGGPVAAALSWIVRSEPTRNHEWGASGGLLGAVAGVCAVIAWFAILFGGRYPDGLWSLSAFYLRWRTRAVAYLMLLRDEYPPFGDGPYPVSLDLETPVAERDRLTVAFRLILAIPHLIVLWILGFAWGLTTFVAWLAILFTGRYPVQLYEFSIGMLQWNIRVEAYLLLLRDEYPPFSLSDSSR